MVMTKTHKLTEAQRQLKYELSHKNEGWPCRHEFGSPGREHLGMIGEGSPLYSAKFCVYVDVDDDYGQEYVAFFATPSVLEQAQLIAAHLGVAESEVLFVHNPKGRNGSPVSAPAYWWAANYGENFGYNEE